MSRRRSGFTLIELLVVIAIIAILIALLVPAVQKVREAAARTQCINNLKQIGIALHGYHDVSKRLPPGSANDMAPLGNGANGWGSSWMVYILPYIEQGPMHSRWQYNNNSGYVNANNIGSALPTNTTIPIYRCPSSSLPDFFGRGGASIQMMVVSYAGIAGSVISPATGIKSGTCCNNGSQLFTENGVLFANSKVRLTDFGDGTSNTIMVGEFSDHLRDANGTPFTAGYQAACSVPGGMYGWTMGAAAPVSGWASGQDGRQFNCVSLRYSINQRGILTTGISGTDPAAANAGVHNDGGQNHPLSSGHTGGCNVLLGDATVRFISDSTSVAILGASATRSGNETVSLDQ